MKILFSKNRIAAKGLGLVLGALVITGIYSCNKNISTDSIEKNKPKAYPAEVVDKWVSMQLRLMKNATGIANHAFSRHFAYSGIAAMESMNPALHGNADWSKKWNGLSGLPVPSKSQEYYFPENVNAALASMNRAMFPNATATDKAAIDSLENALKNNFLLTVSAASIQASETFGKEVAAAVYNWSETDGYKTANNAYTVPVGEGLWKPTAPAFAAPATPYWGNNRPVVTGSTFQTQVPGPVSYSTQTNSSFYKMAKDVYDASLVLTDDQKAMAIFWRDIPGVSSPGHWLSIIQQVIRNSQCTLDKAVLTYAATGAAVNDALIACFNTKYTYSLVRPITYIREVMGNSSWNAYLGTPAHPEYCSAHSSLSAAAAGVLERLFGNPGSFTDHTYDYLGFAPRSYTSYAAIAAEAGLSRFYGGIHYLPSIEAGLVQGRKITDNIFAKK